MMEKMILISALYVEAAPLIKKLNLKPEHLMKGYQCFQDEEKNIILVISGTGKIRMAGAVASVLQLYPCDHLFFFSSCAGLKGQKAGNTYLISKVTDLETGFSYYPDLLYQSDLAEGTLLCGDMPLGIHQKNRDIREPYDTEETVRNYDYDLYDMDTAGGVLMAEKFLGPHEISVVKTVTDTGTYQSRESYQNCMNQGCENAFSYIRMLLNLKADDREADDIEDIAEEMHCSVTMKAQLKQLSRYANASDQNMKEIMKEYHRNGILPCKTREEGKKVLHELTERLTA